MTDKQIENYILEVGYKASKIGEVVDVEKTSTDLGERKKRVEDIVGFMEKKEWLSWWTQEPLQVDITKEGIEEYEKRHEGE